MLNLLVEAPFASTLQAVVVINWELETFMDWDTPAPQDLSPTFQRKQTRVTMKAASQQSRHTGWWLESESR